MGENHSPGGKSESVPLRNGSLHDRGFPSPAAPERREGPPLTVRELAEKVGMSPTFIRTEIHSGHLKAVAIGRGRKCVFRITAAEARRYAQSLGLPGLLAFLPSFL